MSEHESEDETRSGKTDDGGQAGDSGAQPGAIGDEQLPEDLQPTEDNPLARHPGQTGDADDKIGADTEGGDAENPSTSMTYGSQDEDQEDQVSSEEDDGSATLDNGGGGAG